MREPSVPSLSRTGSHGRVRQKTGVIVHRIDPGPFLSCPGNGCRWSATINNQAIPTGIITPCPSFRLRADQPVIGEYLTINDGTCSAHKG